MLNVIDFIVAPLTELNPVKYALNKRYRSNRKRELGGRAGRVFAYWLFLLTVSMALAALIALY